MTTSNNPKLAGLAEYLLQIAGTHSCAPWANDPKVKQHTQQLQDWARELKKPGQVVAFRMGYPYKVFQIMTASELLAWMNGELHQVWGSSEWAKLPNRIELPRDLLAHILQWTIGAGNITVAEFLRQNILTVTAGYGPVEFIAYEAPVRV